MTIWFTSDHHFGHTNIIKYCNRPYNSVAHMNALMEAAWNSVVLPDDMVYYLGDFAMHPNMVTEILPKLNGTKILIAGNHDKCHGGAQKWVDHYMAAGFKSVQKQLDMEIAGEDVLLHRFPYRNEADPAQKHYGSRPVDRDRWLVHGHVHNRWKVLKKQINVSVGPWDFKPVSLETIAALIESGPAESDATVQNAYLISISDFGAAPTRCGTASRTLGCHQGSARMVECKAKHTAGLVGRQVVLLP